MDIKWLEMGKQLFMISFSKEELVILTSEKTNYAIVNRLLNFLGLIAGIIFSSIYTLDIIIKGDCNLWLSLSFKWFLTWNIWWSWGGSNWYLSISNFDTDHVQHYNFKSFKGYTTIFLPFN